MAYTKTNAITAGNTISASEIAANFKDAREYLNQGAAETDIDNASIVAEDIVQGEFSGVVMDHQFTTGNMYGQYFLEFDGTQAITSSHVKPFDQELQTVYVDVWGCGKRIYLHETADVFIQIYANVAGQVNINAGGAGPGNNGEPNYYYLEIDGVIQSQTICYGYDNGLNNAAGQAGDDEARYSPIVVSHLEETLSAGWHDIRLVINPRLELNYIKARVFAVEVMY